MTLIVSDEMPDKVEVVSEAWVVFLELFLFKPLIKCLTDLALAKVKHGLCVFATSFLQAPSCRVSEVKITWKILCAASVMLLEVESIVNFIV